MLTINRTKEKKDLFPGSQRVKYPDGIKEAAIKAYLKEEGSQTYICRKFHISSKKSLQQWLKIY